MLQALPAQGVTFDAGHCPWQEENNYILFPQSQDTDTVKGPSQNIKQNI